MSILTENRRPRGFGKVTLSLMLAVFLIVQESTAKKEVQGNSDALEIGTIICTPLDNHDVKWFKCIQFCQSINVYHLVSQTMLLLSLRLLNNETLFRILPKTKPETITENDVHRQQTSFVIMTWHRFQWKRSLLTCLLSPIEQTKLGL